MCTGRGRSRMPASARPSWRTAARPMHREVGGSWWCPAGSDRVHVDRGRCSARRGPLTTPLSSRPGTTQLAHAPLGIASSTRRLLLPTAWRLPGGAGLRSRDRTKVRLWGPGRRVLDFPVFLRHKPAKKRLSVPGGPGWHDAAAESSVISAPAAVPVSVSQLSLLLGVTSRRSLLEAAASVLHGACLRGATARRIRKHSPPS